ncbi:hypothetical protein HYV10_00195 [Candidatus Dependentiae bacterium]|nr:hypothetical protein [Candidatus Dependentiae bacterium]
MKRVLLILCLILNNVTYNCNLCWDYKIKDPRLKREKISHDASCPCPCWQYPHTQADNNFYRCIQCGHRLTPPDPLSKHGPKYKRFNEEHKNTVKPQVSIKSTNKKANPIEFPFTNLKKK